MEQANIIYLPVKINFDSHPTKIKNIEGRMVKGTRIVISRNTSTDTTSGTSNIITPVQSNEIFCEDLVLPSGENKTIGAFESRETNEIYWLLWNSNDKFTIFLIDGTTENCTQVYQGSCLNFSLLPEHGIPEHRVFVRVQYLDIEGVKTIKEKLFIFTDGNNNVRQINVLASIGSSSFTTPYFTPVYPHYETCSYITSAPIAPMFRPTWTLIDRVEDANGEATDKDIPNKLFNRAIQIAYGFHYVDGRPSTISAYSKPIIVGGTDCSEQNPQTLPRCADITFWAGTAFVDKIDIYYRECTDCPTGGCSSNWVKYKTISKHNCDEDVNWWERTNAWADFQYNSSTNTIVYRFCANEECTPVDQSLFTHIENNIPFKAKALAPLGDRLGLANILDGSDNLSCEEIESFSITVTPQPDTQCEIPDREIKLYVIARNWSNDGHGNGNECQFFFGNSKGGNKSIDGHYYIGGFGWRKDPVGGAVKVAIDGRVGWDAWKDYKQYVPEKIEDITGGFVGYAEGTSYVGVTKQVKFFPANGSVEDLGIIFRDIDNMYKNNGSFDDIVEDLKDGEYLILQELTLKVKAGKYTIRFGGHRSGVETDFQRTSTYIYGHEDITPIALPSGVSNTDAVLYDYEWIVDVCENDYNSLYQGKLMKWVDNTYPDFESDIRNVIDYNLLREVYLSEDENKTIPFEKQQLSFEYGTFKDNITNTVINIDEFRIKSSGIQVKLIDPLTVNILGFGVPIPCPPAPTIPLAGIPSTPSGIVEDILRKTDHNGFVFHVEHFWRWRTFYNTLICFPLFEMTAQFGEPKLGKLSITYTDKCSLDTAEIQVGITQVVPAVTAFSNKRYKGLLGTVNHSTNTSKDLCNRVTYKGKLLTPEGKKLAGVNIGFTESKFVRTDGFGNFKLIVHQNTSFNREGFLMVGNSGSSCLISCVGGSDESCSLCCAETYIPEVVPACVNCEESIVDVGTLHFNKVNFPDKGLKGRYGFPIIGFDIYGRIVTGGANVITYVNIDECWSKHPIIEWGWDGTPLREEIKYISFCRSANLNGTILQWVADKFILLDKNGNRTSNKGLAVAVAVDINSLLDYNKAHNLGTLATYDFVKGDILNILDDCANPIQYLVTGTTFGKVDITALTTELSVSNSSGDTASTKVNYATPNGATIIINYDGRIDDLLDTCGIKIEILRPFYCENNLYPYGEVSDLIPVINGQLNVGDGVLDTWDIYKIFRNIPRDLACINNPSDDPYFSQNITDFWGAGCTDWGRKFTENPYAQRKWLENTLAVSFEWVNNGIVNGLSTFWSENRKNFKGQDWGGILALNAQRGAILFICRNDWFLTSYDQNYLQVGQNGVVVATLPDKISDPTQKVGQNYGVSEDHISSVMFFGGLAIWLDAKNASVIACDYQTAKDISLGSIKGWTIDKTMFIQNYNDAHRNDLDFERILYEVVAGVDPLHKEYHITIRPRNNLGSDIETNFINHERDIFNDIGETMVLDIESLQWVNMRHYTAEYYGKLRTSKSGVQFVSFANGVPYKHNGDSNSSMTFYGIKCTPVLEISVNSTEDKVKIFGAISEEIQPFAMYIDRIITEEENSFSYVPQSYFVKKENIQYSEMLCDMSSYFDPNIYKVSMLVDGKRIFGRYALIRFVLNSENQDKYFELSKILVLVSGSELSMKPTIVAPQ